MSNNDRLRGFNRNIYKQCVWIIRDYYRLLALSEMDKQDYGSCVFVKDVNDYEFEEYAHIMSQNVIDEAKFKIQCISNALLDVPEEYRSGLFKNMAENEDFDDDASYNTWKRWKLVFVRNLARNLNLC